LRVTTKLSEKWGFRARADVGYGGSDNSAVHGMGLFDYRFKDWGSFFAGYRFLSVDFDNGKSGQKG